MDVATIDARYQQLQTQNGQVGAALQQLAGKLAAAAQSGDPNAREWLLDLREIALSVQAEENSVAELVTAMHDFAAGSLQAAAVPGSPFPGQPGYAAPAYAGNTSAGAQGTAGGGAGGTLSHLLGSGLGRAVVGGAGFGLGDDLIQGLFGR